MLRLYLILVITSSDLRNYNSLFIKIKRIAWRYTNDLPIQILTGLSHEIDLAFDDMYG